VTSVRACSVIVSEDDVLASKKAGDFFPFHGGLSPLVKLMKHPIVGGLNRWIIFTEFPAKALPCDEDQTCDSRVFAQGNFQWATDQFRHIERCIHRPEFVKAVRMNAGSSSMGVPAVGSIGAPAA
jgi:hypothetical protein